MINRILKDIGIIVLGTLLMSAIVVYAERTATITPGLQQSVSVGTCDTSTSTPFAILNPYSATSTAEVAIINGLGNATSSSFQVGTSTTATGLTASSVSTNLLSFTIATGTNTGLTMASGVTVGSLGQLSAGANSFRKILVGPNDFVSGFSTSTYGASGALRYTPTACNYKVLWSN